MGSNHRQTLRALKRLRRVYRIARDRAAAELAVADAALHAAQAEHRAAGVHRSELFDAFNARARQADRSSHFELLDTERQHLDADIVTAKGKTQRAAGVRREHAGRVSEAERRLATADRVHDRTVTALRRQQDRAEQALIDDLAPSRLTPSRIKDEP